MKLCIKRTVDRYATAMLSVCPSARPSVVFYSIEMTYHKTFYRHKSNLIVVSPSTGTLSTDGAWIICGFRLMSWPYLGNDTEYCIRYDTIMGLDILNAVHAWSFSCRISRSPEHPDFGNVCMSVLIQRFNALLISETFSCPDKSLQTFLIFSFSSLVLYTLGQKLLI